MLTLICPIISIIYPITYGYPIPRLSVSTAASSSTIQNKTTITSKSFISNGPNGQSHL